MWQKSLIRAVMKLSAQLTLFCHISNANTKIGLIEKAFEHKHAINALVCLDRNATAVCQFKTLLPIQLNRSVLLLLQDQEVARQLVELGHKGSSLKREEFETMKAAAEASRLASKSQQK